MASRILGYFSKLSDYYQAAWLASNRRISKLPLALRNIYTSRSRLGIGPRFYMLFEFSRLPQERWSNYLLDEGLRPILRTINHQGIRNIVDNKVLFHEHCLKEGLATVPILAKFQVNESGKFYPGDFEAFCAALEPKNENLGADEYFCKRVSGSWGQGSFRFKRLNGQWLHRDEARSLEKFSYFCAQGAAGASSEWIIQPLMSVHQDLAEITSSQGLSTVRAISVLDEGKVILLAAMLRITVGENVIDNFSAGQTGNLVASIDLETGRLGQCKGSLSRDFPVVAVFERHPNTGNPVEGFMMPYWKELKSLVVRAHQSLPQFVTLAWDIAVTDEGPVIIEANPTYDVSGMQVAHGKGLKPLLFGYLRRLRPEVINKFT